MQPPNPPSDDYRASNGHPNPTPRKTNSTPPREAGCPTGCGCSAFLLALILWIPALLVARAGGVVGGAVGVTVIVSLFVDVFLILGAKLAMSGVQKSDRGEHLKPFILFAITYLVTFVALLLATLWISRYAVI